nr:protein exportin 1A [Tanacetum cinerariifolium]
MVAILEKGEHNSDFHAMVDFLEASPLRIVPLFDVMLVSQGKGSGTPTEPHHTPSPVAPTPSHTTQPTSSLPHVSTTSIPTLETLLKFFPLPSYHNLNLQCLTEVAALNFREYYNGQYVNMYNIFIAQLQTVLPINTNIPNTYANGNSEEQNLAMFFTFHIRVLEATQENINSLLIDLEYLINISYVDDTQVLKVCLDYWNALVLELYEANHNLESPAATENMMGLQ